ncbi:MAG: thymidine kinase [Bacteroidetes bacterium]|nr:thymidine kinase [Bacteroidota bacterium]MBS1740143.1 thymidine kinase [Bacteroidota bacterium]MBS1775370.1 thymidine kinase [Bacteroidota bacterium]
MFIEPHRQPDSKGWIEVICGSMFSGKTEELIRRLKRAQIAHQKVEIFKPAIDKRYDEYDIVSHDDKRIHSTPVDNAYNILLLASEVDVVGIDEAQFFDEALSDVAEQLAAKGIRVIAAGLDMDFTGKPFGAIPALLAKAEYITKLHAICMQCGDIANFSFRRTKVEDQILLGEKDVYEPRCRACFHKP